MNPSGTAVITALTEKSDPTGASHTFDVGTSLHTAGTGHWKDIQLTVVASKLVIELERSNHSICVFRCDSIQDCQHQSVPTVIDLHGVSGLLKFEVETSYQQTVSFTHFSGRGVVFEPHSGAASDWPALNVRKLVLDDSLVVGDYFFMPNIFDQNRSHCVSCPPGLICAEYIT